MYRRNFLSLASSIAIASKLAAQSKNKLTNVDEHGDMGDMQMPKLAGEDKASDTLLAARVEGAGSVIPVLTRGYDNLRSGTNYRETILTPEAIRHAGGLRLQFTLVMPGDKRGCEAQPLLAPNVQTTSGAYDLCVCATMSSNVWAFDAQTGAPLWMTRLGNPIKGSKQIDGWLINDFWSVLSTEVISGNMLYVVAWLSPDGSPQKASHWFYGIDLRTGQQPAPPLQLTKPGPIQRKQRASLTLVGSNVFIGWGTVQETSAGAHGFLTAVDIQAWKVRAEWNCTPNGSGGGIWQAGSGLVADAQGNLIFMTGNGDFNPAQQNFGECFVKLGYNNGQFQVLDWWCPFSDDQRGQTGGWDDMDLGAGGPVLIPELDLVLGAGKDGILYPVRAGNFGKPSTPGRYDLLAMPPLFFTYFPGFDASPTPKNIRDLDRLWNNRTYHLHGTPLAWKSEQGWRLFCFGENSNLRAWSVERDKITYLARSNEVASPYAPVPAGGMTGGMQTLSANGGKDGVVWAAIPDGDANRSVTTGRLFCFDAQNYVNGIIQRLWMSGPDHYIFNKFCIPTVASGRLYVATYSGTVEVWGL